MTIKEMVTRVDAGEKVIVDFDISSHIYDFYHNNRLKLGDIVCETDEIAGVWWFYRGLPL